MLTISTIPVNLANVSSTSCDYDSLLLEPSNTAQCVSKGKTEKYDCRNHIRVIQPIGNGDRLYVCGTNAQNPRDQVVYANLTNLGRPSVPHGPLLSGTRRRGRAVHFQRYQGTRCRHHCDDCQTNDERIQ